MRNVEQNRVLKFSGRKRNSRNMMPNFLFILCLTCVSTFANAQHKSRTGFSSPLDIPLNLSGNFGEFRTNHFHTGIDIKTQGREGLPVFAVADGYVSRIKISPYGYGTVIYIDHPNGYTSVYAHLSALNDTIESFLRAAQYELESWEVDLYPGTKMLPVKAGEIIARSGNSGSSGGPHLHFEIRETKSEFPVNPLLWEFDVADTRAPLLKGIQVVPLEDSSSVLGSRHAQLFTTSDDVGDVSLARKSPITVFGPIGIGVHTIDQLDGNSNVCGIYRLEVYLDDTLHFEQEIQRLDFANNRFMNAHMDYALMKQEKKSIHRAFRLPYNRLPIYRTVRNDGRINITDDELHEVKVVIYDVHGNRSSANFQLIAEKQIAHEEAVLMPSGAEYCAYDKVNAVRSDSCNVFIPQGRLYDDTWVWIAEVRGGNFRAHSNHYEVGNRYEPVHDEMILKLRTRGLPDSLLKKLVILEFNPDRNRYYNRGGDYKLGWVSARVKSFGIYCIGLDTVPPVIKARKVSSSSLSFNISDDLSGIEGYELRVDGQWVRLHYDPKKARVWYDPADGVIDSESKELVFKVWDERGNEAYYRVTL